VGRAEELVRQQEEREHKAGVVVVEDDRPVRKKRGEGVR
jgi:hypothetical protein